MFTFGIGIFSFIGALLFLVFYFGNIGTRKIVAWVKNEDTTIKEKVWFISILMIMSLPLILIWLQTMRSLLPSISIPLMLTEVIN